MKSHFLAHSFKFLQSGAHVSQIRLDLFGNVRQFGDGIDDFGRLRERIVANFIGSSNILSYPAPLMQNSYNEKLYEIVQFDKIRPEFLQGIFKTLGHKVDVLVVLILVSLNCASVWIKG